MGRVHPGALISVVPAKSGYLSLALPSFSDSSPSELGKPVIALASAGAFGPEQVALEVPAPEGRLVEDFPPGVEIAPAAGAEPFAVTRCGDIHVLAVHEQKSHISQFHAGVELLGWVDAPIEATRGPFRCKLREIFRRGSKLIARDGTSADEVEVSAVPSNYAYGENEEVLLDLIKSGKTVYWLTSTKKNAPRCGPWRFKGARPQGGATAFVGQLTGHPVLVGKERMLPSFNWEYKLSGKTRPGELLLMGPHFMSHTGASRGGYRCTNAYTIVGKTEDALRVFPGEWSVDRVAWHIDDEERWFLTKEACEERGRSAGSALRERSTQPPAGFHVTCFEELAD
ncbi:hypothetical protein WME90_42800 [Sorangium sp. So ce375]|uniref:hypothetical protein n=1 Tax=Sorangium sp. So ce375 TaxID=3133306 RepID=UPI003F5AF71D